MCVALARVFDPHQISTRGSTVTISRLAVCSLLPIAMIAVFAGATSHSASQAPQAPQAPCSNTGVKETSDAKHITTNKSTRCNGSSTPTCGYEEILWPKIFSCSTPGSSVGYCCQTSIGYSRKRTFDCINNDCVASPWVNDQAFTQAAPAACSGSSQSSSCTQ